MKVISGDKRQKILDNPSQESDKFQLIEFPVEGPPRVMKEKKEETVRENPGLVLPAHPFHLKSVGPGRRLLLVEDKEVDQVDLDYVGRHMTILKMVDRIKNALTDTEKITTCTELADYYTTHPGLHKIMRRGFHLPKENEGLGKALVETRTSIPEGKVGFVTINKVGFVSTEADIIPEAIIVNMFQLKESVYLGGEFPGRDILHVPGPGEDESFASEKPDLTVAGIHAFVKMVEADPNLTYYAANLFFLKTDSIHALVRKEAFGALGKIITEKGEGENYKEIKNHTRNAKRDPYSDVRTAAQQTLRSFKENKI